MNVYLLAAFALISGIVLTWLVRKLAVEKHLVTKEHYDQLQAQLNAAQIAHAGELARLKAEISFKDDRLSQQRKEMEEMSKRIESEFRLLANSILEEKAEKFGTQQEQQLKIILEPLKDHIKTFRQEYEQKQSKESEERISLREQVKQMMELNKNLSEQAGNLTNALRGNVKQQGNWGEMILESILQYAGLQKGVQYFVQEQSRNHDGQIIQPDIVVRYPDNRAIVIDSKVSLVHFEAYSHATNTDQQTMAATAMIRSVKSHIDGLSAKSYHDVTDALDFVMMFVPVEAAYISAMQADTALWQYAYNKKILLVSPTNLVAAMKLIADMWQRDGINKEAHLIAERAGKLYDKLVLFVDNFEKVGQQLNRAQDSWNDAYKQLSKGRGNLISQAEQMKNGKAKAAKSLPAAMVEEALIEDGNSLPDE